VPGAGRFFANLKSVGNEKLENSAPDVSAEAGASAEDQVSAAPAEDQLAAISAERDQLAAEKADLLDRLLRRQAEFDNFRRRTERERSEFLQFAGMELARELLPIVDDFERALKVESSDKDYVRGIELIYQRLSEILKRMGVEPLEAAGRPFDPNVHQAVDRVETPEVADQTVLEEYQKGYNFKGKLLRPAMVKVAVKP
jgi:molecular chaperone GrpE